jgi:hypothetical protein
VAASTSVTKRSSVGETWVMGSHRPTAPECPDRALGPITARYFLSGRLGARGQHSWGKRRRLLSYWSVSRTRADRGPCAHRGNRRRTEPMGRKQTDQVSTTGIVCSPSRQPISEIAIVKLAHQVQAVGVAVPYGDRWQRSSSQRPLRCTADRTSYETPTMPDRPFPSQKG